MKGRNSLVTVLALFLIAGMVSAAEDTSESTIDIEISAETSVNVDPYAFAYTGVTPGTLADNSSEANNYYAFQIENIGSNNITDVWANVSQPADSPFATGDPTEYDAGNFIQLANDTGAGFWFVDRVEFPEVNTLVYLTDPNGAIPPAEADYTYGRIRNADQEYFWMIDNSSGVCDTSAIAAYIGNTPHNKTQSGTIDFSGADFQTLSFTEEGDWGVDTIDGGPLTGYCFAAYTDCTQIRLWKYNADAPGGGVGEPCVATPKYLQEDTRDGNLTSGDSVVVYIKLAVPLGVPVGPVTQGMLTIIASDA